jgi:hypothetical protein
MWTTMKNNWLGGKKLSCSYYLYTFRKYLSYGFPIINFCNPGIHYETPCITFPSRFCIMWRWTIRIWCMCVGGGQWQWRTRSKGVYIKINNSLVELSLWNCKLLGGKTNLDDNEEHATSSPPHTHTHTHTVHKRVERRQSQVQQTPHNEGVCWQTQPSRTRAWFRKRLPPFNTTAFPQHHKIASLTVLIMKYAKMKCYFRDKIYTNFNSFFLLTLFYSLYCSTYLHNPN